MGRRKKLVVDKADSYKCSACNFVAQKYEECDRHIIVEHYGQVKSNYSLKLLILF